MTRKSVAANLGAANLGSILVRHRRVGLWRAGPAPKRVRGAMTFSVYCSFGDFSADGEHPAPLIYRQSHVIPSPGDPRGGSLDLAGIPAFLTRDGYDERHGDGVACWPYLRVSLRASEPGEDTVVLDSRQVIALRDELSEWLARVDPELMRQERFTKPTDSAALR